MEKEEENEKLTKKMEAFYKEKNKEYSLPIELILTEQPIEQVVKLEAYKGVFDDGKEETIAQLTEGGEEVTSELFPYKTQELSSGVEYELSENGWLLLLGIEVLEGVGSFSLFIPSDIKKELSYSTEIMKSAIGGGTNFISPKAVVVPEITDFVVLASIPKEKIIYKLVGVGYNNLKILKEGTYMRG